MVKSLITAILWIARNCVFIVRDARQRPPVIYRGLPIYRHSEFMLVLFNEHSPWKMANKGKCTDDRSECIWREWLVKSRSD